MKNREDIKGNSDIYCQHNSFISIKNDIAGITLVALIVTIAILLILAGVSIASFVGDKGLLNETKDIKNNIEDLQNKTIDDLQSIANDLSTSTGNALNP